MASLLTDLVKMNHTLFLLVVVDLAIIAVFFFWLDKNKKTNLFVSLKRVTSNVNSLGNYFLDAEKHNPEMNRLKIYNGGFVFCDRAHPLSHCHYV